MTETDGSAIPDHHRHADQTPGRNPWKVVAIVLASIVGVGLIAWLVWFLVAGQPAPAPSPTPTPTHSDTPTPTPTPTPTQAAALCTTDTASAALGDSDAGAGSVQVPIIFTNTSDAACTLEGFPTVEFVGDENGTELGAPATDDTATSPVALVTIEPGNSAMALLTITIADVDGCTRVDADGFRVIPPGSTEAFFIATTDYQACSEPDTSVLTISAVAIN